MVRPAEAGVITMLALITLQNLSSSAIELAEHLPGGALPAVAVPFVTGGREQPRRKPQESSFYVQVCSQG